MRWPTATCSARTGVRWFIDGHDAGEISQLADGDAGARGAEGRVFLGGTPTVLTVYLGAVRSIDELGVFSFNIDSRANQIFAVRFRRQQPQPGVRPAFSGPSACSSGDKVLGPNAGGFH